MQANANYFPHASENRSLLLFCLQNLHLALSHPTPVITMVTALQAKKMKVLNVNALKAGKAKTAKLVSLIGYCKDWQFLLMSY